MTRSRRLASAALLAAITFLPGTPAAAADEPLPVVSTDITRLPDVRIVVAAPASLGDETLTDAAFRLAEDGQPRAVRVEPLPADQMEVALVIDTSGSMAGAPLAAAKDAARSFLQQLPAGDPLSVVAFGATPTVVSSRSSDRTAQDAAISALTAKGQTALYDALGGALSQLTSGSTARRAVVLLTDGGDTSSTTTLDETSKALAAAQIPLFAVELQTKDSNPGALSQLTTASGGRVVAAADPGALAGAFGAVARQLVRQYAVTYRAEARGPTDVDVVLEAQGVRATTRRHFELPAAPVAPPAPAAPAAAAPPVGGAPTPLGSWALVLGTLLCGTSLLVVLLLTLGSRTPRARGLNARRRGIKLADAADRFESLGSSVLRRRGGMDAVNAAIEAAGLDVRPGELLVAVVVADLVALGLGWALIGPVAGLLLALAVPVLARGVLRLLAQRRRAQFSNQLAETLQILSGSLRAGHGLAQGIETVAREADSPTAEEFRRLTIEARLGRDFVDALASLAERVGGDDFQWVIQAIEIQREVGGDLAEVLDTVGDTIRDRTRIRRQAAALSAEGRMSAWVLMILPLGLGAVMAVTNPDFLSPLVDTGTGHVLLAVGAALMAVGGLWLKKIVKPIF